VAIFTGDSQTATLVAVEGSGLGPSDIAQLVALYDSLLLAYFQFEFLFSFGLENTGRSLPL
jgi:hypothetical protein